MTTETTYILVEIIHKGPLKKNLARDLPGRLSQAAYDLVQARGADCLDATAKQVEPPKEVGMITWEPAFLIPGRPNDVKVIDS